MKNISKAHWDLTTNYEWLKLFRQYPGLSDCISSNWAGIAIECVDFDIDKEWLRRFDPERKKMIFNKKDLQGNRGVYLVERLLQQIIWMCGGRLLDAYVIPMLLDESGEFFEELIHGPVRIGLTRDAERIGEYGEPVKYDGKWIEWDPQKGQMFNKSMPGRALFSGRFWSTFWRMR